MTKHRKGIADPNAVKLAAWAVEFVNTAWGRRLRASKSLVDSIADALENGYTRDEVRSAFWVTATLVGDDWPKEAMRPGDRAIAPEIILRFHGGVNPQSGKEAVRWLDDRLARVEETSAPLIQTVLARLRKAMGTDEARYNEEVDFLKRVGFPLADDAEA